MNVPWQPDRGIVARVSAATCGMISPDIAVAHPGYATARMQPLARLPVFLALEGKRAIVAGGSAAAAWKAELLAAGGAGVDVYAETFCEELCALATASRGRSAVALHPRGWRREDLPGAAVAIGDFVGKDEAGAFAQAARATGVLVNVIDKPAYCDFSFGAVVNRSPLVIGISTDGAAPAFAQAIRTRLEALIPRGFARWAAAGQRWRARLGNCRLSSNVRRRFWQNFAALALAQAEREPQPTVFSDLLDQSVRDGACGGTVTVLSDLPRDPDALTLREVRALASADVLLIDDDVAPDILEFTRREAVRLPLRGLSEAEIAAEMSRLTAMGKRVVRVS
jgi:uroporphyrin-III C-methyltransferase/precorrin-2 dehydrogenase/sirohydrochlorin ferrochelatase